MTRGWVFALALFAFLLATAGADTVAQMEASGVRLGTALTSHLSDVISYPEATLFLASPFIVLGCLFGIKRRAHSNWKYLAIFGIAALAMIFIYYRGYADEQVAIDNERWTAAALSVGLLPFLAAPILLVASLCIVAIYLRELGLESST